MEINYITIRRVLITLTLLLINVSAFFFINISGRPNLIPFILIVILCFAFITIFLIRHIYIGIVIMIVGGIFGFLTDIWGTRMDVFQYVPETMTLLVLSSGELGSGGIPVEIVASYFFAGMWFTQIIESFFGKEMDKQIDYFKKCKGNIINYKQTIPAIIVSMISIFVIMIKPTLIQPWIYFSIGVFMICLIPRYRKFVPVIFGLIVAIVGLFLELFCSGELMPNVVIWTYTNPDWRFEHTYSALIAYFGVGATLASLVLLLLRNPIFRITIKIL